VNRKAGYCFSALRHNGPTIQIPHMIDIALPSHGFCRSPCRLPRVRFGSPHVAVAPQRNFEAKSIQDSGIHSSNRISGTTLRSARRPKPLSHGSISPSARCVLQTNMVKLMLVVRNLFWTTRMTQPGSARQWCPPASSRMAFTIAVVLLFGLVSGLFHHHRSASESGACTFCHTIVNAQVGKQVAIALSNPPLLAMGTVELSGDPEPAVTFSLATLIPRAPPILR